MGNDAQGPSSFCEFLKSSAGSDPDLEVVAGRSLGSSDYRGHLRKVIELGPCP